MGEEQIELMKGGVTREVTNRLEDLGGIVSHGIFAGEVFKEASNRSHIKNE